MKKITFFALAAMALASCSNDETLQMEQEAISFGNPFVGKSTRATAADPSYGVTNSLTSFKVWGAVKSNDGNSDVAIFANDEVTGTVGESSVWICTKTQYWIYGAKYNFAAVVNAGTVEIGTDQLPATIAYTLSDDATTDLLYARSKNDIVRNSTDADKKVAMQFEHLLSKVKFTAVNTTLDTNYTFNIKDLKITNASASGTYKVEGKTWTWSATDSKEISIGAVYGVTYGSTIYECAQEKLLIPADFTTTQLAVSYTLEWLYNGTVITSDSKTALVSVDLQKGYAYNFVITTGLNEPIQFTVTENPSWTTAPDVDVQ